MATQYSSRAAALKASKGKGVHKMPNGKYMVGKSHSKPKSKGSSY
jgi:hypothetical protein